MIGTNIALSAGNAVLHRARPVEKRSSKKSYLLVAAHI